MLTAIHASAKRYLAHGRRGCCGHKIDPEKIGALIGPGGKTIRGIQETTGAVIEVDDDGTVTIASTTPKARKRRWPRSRR